MALAVDEGRKHNPAGTALTAWLSLWQWDRAAQKEALQATLDSRASQPVVDADDLARSFGRPSAAAELLYRRLRLHGR